ncbi:MAG: hypothetical protein ACM3WV_04575 [Bacillota bacterium]
MLGKKSRNCRKPSGDAEDSAARASESKSESAYEADGIRVFKWGNNAYTSSSYQIATKIDLLVSKFLRLNEQAANNYPEWEKKGETARVLFTEQNDAI